MSLPIQPITSPSMGILTEYCLMRLPPNFEAVALGLRYLDGCGLHYIQTSIIKDIDRNRPGHLQTADKIYQLGVLIIHIEHQEFYAKLAAKTVGTRIFATERILQIATTSVS